MRLLATSDSVMWRNSAERWLLVLPYDVSWFKFCRIKIYFFQKKFYLLNFFFHHPVVQMFTKPGYAMEFRLYLLINKNVSISGFGCSWNTILYLYNMYFYIFQKQNKYIKTLLVFYFRSSTCLCLDNYTQIGRAFFPRLNSINPNL